MASVPDAMLNLQRRIGNQGVVQLLRASQGDGEASRAVIQRATAGGGRPVDTGIRNGVETRFGADLGSVRVHTGPEADASAAALGASAYTVGDDIVVGEGGSADRETLHHELTHVVQQRQGPVAGTDIGGGVAVSNPADRFEREAEQVASELSGASQGQLVAPEPTGGGVPSPTVQRQVTVQRLATPKWLKAVLNFLNPGTSRAEADAATNLQDLDKEEQNKAANLITQQQNNALPAGQPPQALLPEQQRTTKQPFGYWAPTKKAGDLDMLQAGGKHDYSDVNGQDNYATAKASMGARAQAGARARDGQAQALASAAAQMGLSADAHGLAGDEEGLHAAGGARIGATLGANADARAAGGLLRNDRGNVRNIYGEVGANAGVGLSGYAGAEGEVGYGSLTAGGGVSGSGQIGAEGHLAGNASIGTHGLNVGGAAGVSASASGEAAATAEFNLKDFGIEAELGVDGWAGAEADAHGTFQVGRSGVKIGGGATIGAGATANVTGDISAKLYDRKVLGVKASAGVQAGYIYSASGWFEVKGGYIRINAGLAASLLAPVGGSLNVEPYADLKPLAVAIMRNYYGAKWRYEQSGASKGGQAVLDAPDAALKGFAQDLQKYSDLKFRYLQTKSAYNYVKIEKIQQLVNKRIPYYMLRAIKGNAQASQQDKDKAKAIDDGITRALRAVLKTDPESGKDRVSPQVDFGKIETILDLYDTGGMTDTDDPAFNIAVDGGGAVSATQTLSGFGS